MTHAAEDLIWGFREASTAGPPPTPAQREHLASLLMNWGGPELEVEPVSLRSARARLAQACRRGTYVSERALEARRDFAAVRLEHRIRGAIAVIASPPRENRVRLVGMLDWDAPDPVVLATTVPHKTGVKLEGYVRGVISGAGELTDEQRARLESALLI